MGEVSVRVSRRSHALIHLRHVQTMPREIFPRKHAQHLPGGVAAADSQGEAPPRRHRSPALPGDDFGRLGGNGGGVGEYADFHEV